MTEFPALEDDVAVAAEVWREASRGAAEDAQAAERPLAGALEQWIAAMLANEERWRVSAGWSDGLVFLECREDEDGWIRTRGYIWSLGQVRHPSTYPFRADLRVTEGALSAFDVRFGDGTPENPAPPRNPRGWELLRYEPDWGFRFSYGA